VSAVISVAVISNSSFELTVNNTFQNPTQNAQQIRVYENGKKNGRELRCQGSALARYLSPPPDAVSSPISILRRRLPPHVTYLKLLTL